jgi:hypothetical protein
MKILSFFLFFWVIFPLLDPDPDPTAQIIADPCGSGSETLHIGNSDQDFGGQKRPQNKRTKVKKVYFCKCWNGCSLLRAGGVSCFPSSRPRNNNMGIFYNKTYEFISTVKFEKKNWS